MRCNYADVRHRVVDEPKWFDESSAPRYCEFSPSTIAGVYSEECALILVACQACEREFPVAVSASSWQAVERGARLADSTWLVKRRLRYGDPPNVGCCPTGPTMNSVPRRVLEFWSRRGGADRQWRRIRELEVEIKDAK